jgi:phage terminase small subunit
LGISVVKVYSPNFVFPVVSEKDLSPEMRALTDYQRRFVWAMLETGGQNHTEAARLAGSKSTEDGLRVRGFELTHNPKVLAALRVEAIKRMTAHGVRLADDLVTIATNPEAKDADRLKAIGMVMDRTGMQGITERHIVVQDDRRSREDLLREFFKAAKDVGIPMGRIAGPVIEGRVEAEPTDE